MQITIDWWQVISYVKESSRSWRFSRGNSKWFFKLILVQEEVYFKIPVSLTVVLWNTLFAHRLKFWWNKFFALLSTSEKLVSFINSLLTYSRFESPTNYKPVFDCSYLKIIEVRFSFPELVSACKKLFHLFILQIQSSFESCDHTGHNHFRPCPPQNYELVSTCKKPGNFINLFWRYSWF